VKDNGNAVSAAQAFTLNVGLDPPILLGALSSNAAGYIVLPDAKVGVPYRFQIPLTGGTPPYSLLLLKNEPIGVQGPPVGMYFDQASVSLLGTPTSTTYTPLLMDVLVTDSCGSGGPVPRFQISVSQNPTISGSQASSGIVGQSYFSNFAASGGQPPYQWNVTGGSLPPGLSLVSSAIAGTYGASIQGTPTTAGGSPYSFSLSITDATGTVSPSIPLSITIQDVLSGPSAALSFNSPNGSLPPAQSITWTEKGGANTYQTKVSCDQGSGWLSVTPSAGNLAPSFSTSISIQPAGLTAGTWSATITMTSDKGASASVRVALTVSASVTAVPKSLRFFAYQGGISPQPQGLSIFSLPAGSAFGTIGSTSGGNWLSVAPGAATPFNAAVSVSSAGLLPGTYQGSVSLTFSGQSVAQVPVTLVVSAPPAPKLSVAAKALRYFAEQGAGRLSGAIPVANVGGGILNFTSSLIDSNCPWLNVGNPSGSAAAATVGSIGLMSDYTGLLPGVYSCRVAISDKASSDQAQVAISLVVRPPSPSLSPSQTALSFAVSPGGSAPPRSFSLANAAAGSPLPWTAHVEYSSPASAGWLTFSPQSGTVAPQGTAIVTATANSAGLAAGQYFAALRISSAAAPNSPQELTVVLNVSPKASAVVLPVTSILLQGQPYSRTSASGQLTVFNASSSPVTYSSAAFTNNKIKWLTLSPASGVLNPGTNTLQVLADTTSNGPGVQAGNLDIAFSDGSSASVQAILAAPACSGGQPSAIIATIIRPTAGEQLVAGSPVRLAGSAVDDCGQPLSAVQGGVVEAVFAGTEPPISLNDTGGGVWEATWVPQNSVQTVSVTMHARLGTVSGNSSAVEVTVAAIAADGPPLAAAVINAAAGSAALPQILAPGSFFALYGSDLTGSGSPVASSVPLPLTLNGTQVFLGSVPVPLLYAASGQINGIVPASLPPNAPLPLVIAHGSSRSAPLSVVTARLQPAIYTVDTSGSGPGIVTVATTGLLANSSNPALRGSDYLVIYCTGLGPVKEASGAQPPADGAAAPFSLIFSTAAPTSVVIGGVSAIPQFAGLTPGLVGLYQVNVLVPPDAPPGDAVPLTVTSTDPDTGVVATSNTVTVALR
jgi:uncharacterized protein (TIGR03437 family)